SSLRIRRPPRAPPFPYTTLFRSWHEFGAQARSPESSCLDGAGWQSRPHGTLTERRRPLIPYPRACPDSRDPRECRATHAPLARTALPCDYSLIVPRDATAAHRYPLQSEVTR